MRTRIPCVYLLASAPRGTLYIGVTSDPVQRIWQHKNHCRDGFSRRYEVKYLVWIEMHETMLSAIAREKTLKSWKRIWKLQLVESANPQWRDLYSDIIVS